MKKEASWLVLCLAVGGIAAALLPAPPPAEKLAEKPAALPVNPGRALASGPRPRAAAAVVKMPAEKLGAYFDRLQKLNACYGGSCDYPRTDSRSYDFAVGQDLKNTLEGIAETAAEQHWQNDDLASIGRAHLKSSDGFVQEAALALLATQPPSEENLDAVLQNVIAGYDAQLIQAGLKELARYDGDADQEKISQSLSGSMVSGAPFVAKEIARAITPFLFPRTIAVYEEAFAAMPEGSTIKMDLGKSINEFHAYNP